MYQSRLLRTTACIATVCLIVFAIIVIGFRKSQPDNHADEGTVDYRPVFSDFNRDVDIFDDVSTENCLTVIVAKRFNNTHNAMPNKNIIYSLEDNKSFFSIDNAGCLRMKTSINTSMVNGKLNWCIYIIASDEKYPMNTNKVAININLKKKIPTNNDAYLYNNKSDEIYVHERLETTKSPSNKTEQKYKIQTNNSYSYNNKSDKNNVPELLETTKSLSNEKEQKYKIPITTLDNEQSFDNSTPKLIVEIDNKHEGNLFKFSQPIYIAFVSENATVATPVTKHLEVNNLGQVEFRIFGNDTNDFSISHIFSNDSNENINSTQIIVNQALSYLNKSIYEFYIMASDDISVCSSQIIIYVRKENDTGIIVKTKHVGNDTTCSKFFKNVDDKKNYIQHYSAKCITNINAVDTYFKNGLAGNPIIYDIRIISMAQSPSYRDQNLSNRPLVAINENTGCIIIRRYSYSRSCEKLAVRAYYEQDDSVEPWMSKCLIMRDE